MKKSKSKHKSKGKEKQKLNIKYTYREIANILYDNEDEIDDIDTRLTRVEKLVIFICQRLSIDSMKFDKEKKDEQKERIETVAEINANA